MPDFNWLTGLFGTVGLAGFVSALWGPIKDWRSGSLRHGRADAERADVEVDQLHAMGPLAQDGVRLTQADLLLKAQSRALEELGAQLSAANTRVADRDRQLADQDVTISLLRNQVRDRDAKIDELELRVGTAEDELRRARSIIAELRESPDHTQPSG
jgi:chromosome segregation ATPase